MIARPQDWYGDGLDDDGYPLPPSGRKRYCHGSEEDAGEFRPVSLAEGTASVLERLARYKEIGGSTDSPIEDLMGASMLMFFARTDHPLTLCKNIDLANVPEGLLLVPQFKWGFYRSDWAIVNAKTGGAFLVECDGKEFHDSREQKEHDAKKDMAALDRGFLTMRFPGWRINKDPDSCAQKVYDAIFGGA